MPLIVLKERYMPLITNGNKYLAISRSPIPITTFKFTATTSSSVATNHNSRHFHPKPCCNSLRP